MIAVLIIAHAPLASALAQSASHVYACAPDRATKNLRVLDVAADSDIAATVKQARELMSQLDCKRGVLVLTDVLGASPSNVAAQLAEPNRVAVLAGVNLPMLLRTLCYREGSLVDTVEKALSGGQQGVVPVPAPGTSMPGMQNQGSRSLAANPSDNDKSSTSQNDPARLHHQQ